MLFIMCILPAKEAAKLRRLKVIGPKKVEKHCRTGANPQLTGKRGLTPIFLDLKL